MTRSHRPEPKIGRPTKRTPDIEELIFRGFRNGLGLAGVASVAGIAKSTLELWMAQDERFRADCEVAFGAAKARVTAKLFALGVEDGNLGALVWWQKCRDPEFREPKDQTVVLSVDEVTDQRGLSRLMMTLAARVAKGEAPVSALRDFAEACAKVSEVHERSELESRVAALEVPA